MVNFFQMTGNSFPQWIETQMAKRGWRAADLARKSGVDNGTLSNVLNGVRGPGLTFCTRLADAFQVRHSIVLQEAGLITGDPAETPTLAECQHLFAQLSDDDQEVLLAQMHAILELRERREERTYGQAARTHRDMAALRPGGPARHADALAEDGRAHAANENILSAASDHRGS